MGSHPVNLALRFLLELGALFGLGAWGWRGTDAPGRYLLAVGLPVVAALLWGTFAVPDDPSRSGRAPVPVPGAARLVLELVIFTLGTVALRQAGFQRSSLVFGALVVLHYLVSYDRIAWLLRG